MPTVSIIVPIYRVEAYLRPCVQSVLDQTFSDFELILVDDGSPDGCPALCDEFASLDPRIRVIHKKNGGAADARNAGLCVAEGSYIYFLDGDDKMDPNLLETVIPPMNQGADMVVFNYRELYQDGTTKDHFFQGKGDFFLEREEQRLDFLTNIFLTYKIGWEPWDRIFRRDLIEKYAIRFEEGRVNLAEDLYFCLCYCAHARTIRCIEDRLYSYVQRESSTMATQGYAINAQRYVTLAKAVLDYFRSSPDCGCFVEGFPTFFYRILAEQLLTQFEASGLPAPEFREILKAQITDWEFFENHLRRQLQQPKVVMAGYPRRRGWEQRSLIQFLLDGGYTRFRLRNKGIYFYCDTLKR